MSWPDPARLRWTPTLRVPSDDGTEIAVEVLGDGHRPALPAKGGSPTLVFAHGWTFSSRSWHYQRMLAERYRLVLMDHRDHGESGTGPRENRTVDQIGRDLAAVLDATCEGKDVVLVGHSMGGMTIMALAAARPDLFGSKIIGTVLVSTAAAGIDPASWLPAPLRPVVRQASPSLLRGAAGSRMAALVERARQAGGDVAFLSTRYLAFGDPDISPAIVDFLECIIRATPIEVIAQFYLALTDHDQRAALAALGRAPAVVLVGDRDRLVAPGLAAELAAGIPGAEVITVAGAGHVLILERPDIVTDAITGLLDRVLPRPGSQPRPA